MTRAKWEISLVLVLAALLALPAAHAAPAAPRATRIIRFVPRSPGRGMLGGYCWTGSIAVARPDAYRCMAGNEIFDPCFAGPNMGFVVCDPNPAKGDPGLAMKLTKPLPPPEGQAGDISRQGGWLVELADGTTCSPRTGAGWEVDGKIVNYYCHSTKKGIETDLLGDFDTGGPLWTAQKASITQSAGGPKLIKLEKAAVKRVWR